MTQGCYAFRLSPVFTKPEQRNSLEKQKYGADSVRQCGCAMRNPYGVLYGQIKGAGSVMKKLLNTIMKVLLVVVITFGALFMYGYYEEYPVRTFCAGLPEDATPGDAVTLAKEKGLPVFDSMKVRNTIVVLNHKSPLSRVACEIEFKDNLIVSKGIRGAD
jgi:hypothetical protein